MTSPGGPGNTTTMQQLPPAPYYYGEPDEPPFHEPEPRISLADPKVALALAGLALIVGFALAALLFGVILNSDDSESIAGSGNVAAPTIAPPVDETETAMTDASVAEATTPATVAPITVATTIATTVPPTTAATTTAAPTTVTTAAPTTVTTAAPATSATTVADTVQAPPPPPASGDAAIQQQVLDLTNAERAKAGCNAVSLDQTLNAVADRHSEDMAANNYFDHTGRDGSQPWDRVQAAGYPARGSGENIAQGYTSPADVVSGWMDSPGHRRNMLDCSWTELGVGYAEGGGSGSNVRPLYWTQVFATRG